LLGVPKLVDLPVRVESLTNDGRDMCDYYKILKNHIKPNSYEALPPESLKPIGDEIVIKVI
jgi:hypothetical protein